MNKHIKKNSNQGGEFSENLTNQRFIIIYHFLSIGKYNMQHCSCGLRCTEFISPGNHIELICYFFLRNFNKNVNKMMEKFCTRNFILFHSIVLINFYYKAFSNC